MSDLIGKDEIIEQLPEDWSEEAEVEAPEKSRKYQELQQRLVEVTERRRVAKERLEQYRNAKQLLVSFEGEDAGLQSNLVVKNGEIEKELERMRMLMLRVERGLMGLEDRQGDEMDIDVVDDDGEEKLRRLIG